MKGEHITRPYILSECITSEIFRESEEYQTWVKLYNYYCPSMGCVRLAYLPKRMPLFSNLLCKNQMGVNLPTLPFLLLFAILSYSHALISFTVYTSVACAVGSSVSSTSSTDFSFQNLVFWNLFEF
jgi:hypothetical protein